MPSSATATKAAQTRQRERALTAQYVRQGMTKEEANARARRELGLKKKSGAVTFTLPSVGSEPQNTTPEPAKPSAPPAPGSIADKLRQVATGERGGGWVPGGAGSTPAAASPASAAPAAGPSTAGTQQASSTVAPPPPPPPVLDPIQQAAKDMGIDLSPTWEIDGQWFRCWLPQDPKNKVVLPIAETPGPFTPTEVVHPVLGMPEMLFMVCVAIAENMASLITGPTGVAKTTIYRWLAQTLNWNVIPFPMHKDIASEDLVGEPRPVANSKDELVLRWTWGMVSKAVLASQEHPTIGVFEEVNRVGNLQAYARLYSLLDDTRQLVITEKVADGGKPAPAKPRTTGTRKPTAAQVKAAKEKAIAEAIEQFGEVLTPGKFYVGANMNPVDSDAADYIGVLELDPALRRRFPIQLEVGYPPVPVEAEALRRRVKGLEPENALKMVRAATRVREAADIRFPMSFPDLVSWATVFPYYGWDRGAEVAVVSKAHADYQPAIRDLVLLKPNAV